MHSHRCRFITMATGLFEQPLPYRVKLEISLSFLLGYCVYIAEKRCVRFHFIYDFNIKDWNKYQIHNLSDEHTASPKTTEVSWLNHKFRSAYTLRVRKQLQPNVPSLTTLMREIAALRIRCRCFTNCGTNFLKSLWEAPECSKTYSKRAMEYIFWCSFRSPLIWKTVLWMKWLVFP